MKFRKGTFSIKHDEGLEEVKGYLANDIYGWLGIHKHGSLWIVTHILTGRKITDAPRLSEAKDMCVRILDSMVSLDFMSVNELSQENQTLLKKAVRYGDKNA